jgi:surface polysaccharide O-acyltransferase-like enzyme
MLRDRMEGLLAAAVLSLIFYVNINNQATFGMTGEFALSTTAWVLAGWFSLLAIFGLGERFLTKESALLRYGSTAAMPFYVLHQPVIVLLGFFARSMALAPVLKALLLYLVAFAVILGLCHWVVRPFPVMQFLFGVKAARKPVQAEKAA